MDVHFSSSYTDAAPLGCDVPQSFTLGPRPILFLHLFLLPCSRVGGNGAGDGCSISLDAGGVENKVLTPTFGRLLWGGAQQTRSIRFLHRMLRGWEAWSWRRESMPSSCSPGEGFQAHLTRRPWGRPKTCSPLKVLQPQPTCRKGAEDGWMDSTLKKTLSHLPVMCKMSSPINYSQEDSIQALLNWPRGLKTGFHWTFRWFVDDNTDIVLLPCPVWSLWGLYVICLTIRHESEVCSGLKGSDLQCRIKASSLLLAVPETFIFTYGYTLAFALLLSPFINHFTFTMCNLNWWGSLLLNNDAASRHDCAGCGSVPHKNQLPCDHLAHLWRFERRNTNSFSVLFIPSLRPWGKEAGIHPGYVTSPSQDTHQSKPAPCFREPRTWPTPQCPLWILSEPRLVEYPLRFRWIQTYLH